MKKWIASFTIFLTVFVATVYLALTNTDREENKAALALIQELQKKDRWSDFAFFSSPNNCASNLSEHKDLSKELIEDFNSSNSNKGPIYLVSLEGHVNLVTWEDNQQIHDTANLAIKFRPSEKVLVALSRAGFSKDKNQAILCLHKESYGEIFHLQKVDGKWVVNNT